MSDTRQPLRTPGECLTLGGHVYPNGRHYGDGRCVYCGREQGPKPPRPARRSESFFDLAKELPR